MTPIEQLNEWVKGNPVHNDERDECCPDFSCCMGNGYITEVSVRKEFAEAYKTGNDAKVHEMLMMFLGQAFPKSYIAGGEPPGLLN